MLLTYVSKWKGCTQEEAEQWICAPCVLRRGMTWAEAQTAALDLSGCTVQILPRGGGRSALPDRTAAPDPEAGGKASSAHLLGDGQGGHGGRLLALADPAAARRALFWIGGEGYGVDSLPGVRAGNFRSGVGLSRVRAAGGQCRRTGFLLADFRPPALSYAVRAGENAAPASPAARRAGAVWVMPGEPAPRRRCIRPVRAVRREVPSQLPPPAGRQR